MEAITSVRKAYFSLQTSERVELRDAAERALLIELREAMSKGELTEASQLIDTYERDMGMSENRVEFLILKAGLYEQQGRYSEVLKTIEGLRPFADSRLSAAIENIDRDNRMAAGGEGIIPQAPEMISGSVRASKGEEDGIADERDSDATTRLDVAYPNPFNPQTTIPFELAESARVEISVYDILGRQVAVLVNGVKESGKHSTSFDASALPTGVYFVRARFATAGGEVNQFSERIVLQK